MIVWLWNSFFLIVTIGVLVTVHEFGHFWVARKLGVKVEVFSIGFGKALWSRRAADGVEYRIAWIPLGGYVRMLDERESDTPLANPEGAFNRQSVWVRTAVVVAGPLANFIFAVFAFAAMAYFGTHDLRAILGPVPIESHAGKAGLMEGMEIIQVDGENVTGWSQLNLSLVSRIGDEKNIEITAKTASGEQRFQLPAFSLEMKGHDADLMEQLGLTFKQYDIPAKVAVIAENGPAQKFELQIGDLITHFEQETVNWYSLVEMVQARPDESVRLRVLRNGQEIELLVTLGHQTDGNQRKGYLGISPESPKRDADEFVLVQLPIWESVVSGMGKTIDTTRMTLDGLYKLITGKISVKTLSGPVSIAKGAGSTAAAGIGQFFWFLGLVSVNLGLINLLPIPVLDGGHLMYNIMEMLRGKPISEYAQEWGLRIGMSLVGALMFIALFNDFARL